MRDQLAAQAPWSAGLAGIAAALQRTAEVRSCCHAGACTFVEGAVSAAEAHLCAEWVSNGRFYRPYGFCSIVHATRAAANGICRVTDGNGVQHVLRQPIADALVAAVSRGAAAVTAGLLDAAPDTDPAGATSHAARAATLAMANDVRGDHHAAVSWQCDVPSRPQAGAKCRHVFVAGRAGACLIAIHVY